MSGARAGLALVLLAACARTAPAPAPPVATAEARPYHRHLALGVPTDGDPRDELLLDHRHFVVSYDPRRRMANWVGWRLEAADLGPVQRRDDFHPDVLLPVSLRPVRPGDYRGSGFDRGHLCPSADRTATPEANSATFVMTNIHPQRPGLNRGPWRVLEEFARELAARGQRLYIVAGGLFDAGPLAVGAPIAAPRASYKILVVLAPGQEAETVTAETPVYAVVMPNSSATAGRRWQEYLVSVDEVERDSGYDFLGALPPAVSGPLEARHPAAGE
jgi:endonuclease G